MEHCPKRANYTYAWGVCTNNNCNYPAWRSNNAISRKKAAQARARQRRSPTPQSPRHPAPTASFGEVLEGIGILGMVAAGGTLGLSARSDAPEGLMVGAGIGFVLGLALRKLLRVVVACGAVLGVLVAIAALHGA